MLNERKETNNTSQKLILPFIYEDNKQHYFFLKKTKELVTSTNGFNRYYESYLKSINVEKFHMPNLKSTYDLPVLQGLDQFTNKLDISIKLNESSNFKDSIIDFGLGKKSTNNTSVTSTFHKRYKSLAVMNSTLSSITPTNNDIWDFDYNDILFKNNQAERLDFESISKKFKERVLYYKNNKNLNVETYLVKRFNLGKESSLELTLNCFNIKFKNIKDQTEVISIDIPLALSPFMYYALLNFEKFKKMLCCLLLFSEDCKKIEFQMEELDLVIQAFSNTFDKEIDIRSFKTVPFQSKFDWITENIIYEVTVASPNVELYFKRLNCRIVKFCEPEDFGHIYLHNFDNWGSYFRNRLNTNRMFRETINKIFSKKNVNEREDHASTNLDEDKPNYYKEMFDNKMGFCVTNHYMQNRFFTLHSYSINVTHPDLENKDDPPFTFKFNFAQMKIIYKVGRKFNLKKFFSKMLSCNISKALINIDKSYFTTFSDFMLDFLDRNKQNLITEGENTRYVLLVKKPHVTVEYFDKGAIKPYLPHKKEDDLEYKLLTEIMVLPIEQWNESLSQAKKTLFTS